MKLFISWSGSVSKRVATVLAEWIHDVLPAVKPFVSSENIISGKRWPLEPGRILRRSTLESCV